MLVDVQFSSAHNDWGAVRDAILQAEAEGYDTTWVFDHFDGTVLGGDRPLLECFTLMGAMAAATTRIGIGALVVNVANRHPAVMAAAASTVDRISAGRLRLGIGAGTGPGTPWAREHHERGIPLQADMAGRHQAVVRQIEALRAATQAPVVVGVNSIALATLAGQHADGVNVRLSSPSAPALVEAARAAAEHAGGRPFEASGWCNFHDDESRALAERLGLQRLILTRLEPLG